jgi:hypothetical protein
MRFTARLPHMTARFFVHIFFLLLLAAPLAAQGPLDGYLKGRRVLDLAPSISFNKAATFAGAGGQSYETPYQGSLLSLFAEYGVSKKIDLVATAAYVFTSNQSGLQDGGLYAKYRPLRKKLGKAGHLDLLLGAGASFPLSDYAPTVTGALGQKAVSVPARLIAQWETSWGIFLNLTGGYNWRLDRLDAADIAQVRSQRPDYRPTAPPHFSTFLVKIGLPARHYYLDAWAEWQHTLGGADYQPNVPDLPQAYGVSYAQVGGTAYYSENGRTGFYLSGGYILGGRNTSRIRRITLGMVFKIKPPETRP